MVFKIGETIQINGINLLVLDVINGNPFVIALDLNIKTAFDSTSNNYKGSILEKRMNDWGKETGLPFIPRSLDLTTMDGSKRYGEMEVTVAPLTFDEFRKYAWNIIPNIRQSFWLATAWADPKWNNLGSHGVCFIYTDGGIGGNTCFSTSGYIVPAFILDKSLLNDFKKKPTLSDFSTDELLAEISKRAKEN